MRSKVLKVLKPSLIIAACFFWLLFAIKCWDQLSPSSYLPGDWVRRLTELDLISNNHANTYLLLSGFVFFAFYLTVLLPDLMRRFFPLKGKTLLVFRIAIIGLTGVSGIVSVTACDAVPALHGLSAGLSPDQLRLLRLCNSVLTPVSICLILFTWLLPVVIRFFRDSRRNRSLTPAGVRKTLAFYGLLAVLAVLVLAASAVLLAFVKAYSATAVNYVTGFLERDSYTLAGFFHMVVLAPVIEETAFRGLIQNHTQRTIPANLALVLTSVFFGLWHRNLGQFVYTFACAMIWGYVYNATGKIRHTMLMHGLLNLLAFLAFSVSGQSIFGKQTVLPAIGSWLINLPLVPAILMFTLLVLLIIVTAEAARYLATGKEGFFLRLIKRRPSAKTVCHQNAVIS